jgi:hypothetical protein
MANVKITDLTAYTNPASTDVLPIVDVGADILKNAGSGTAAAPGIAFDGDSDTGIYRPGANQLALSTNGQGRLFVDASGNINIGGSDVGVLGSAGKRLAVGTTSAGTSGAVTIFSSTSGLGYLAFGDGTAGSDSYRGLLEYDHTSDSLRTYTAGSQRMVVTSAGLVGIGTSSPSVVLHAVGGVGFPATSGTSQANGTFRIGGPTTTGVIDFGVQGSANWLQSTDRTDLSQKYSLLLNPNGGNVGIGTTSPNVPLEVNGNARASNFSVPDTNFIGFGSYTAYLSGSSASNFIDFNTSSTERVRIDSSGRLLVGTSSDSGDTTLVLQGNSAGNTGTPTIAFKRNILPAVNNDIAIISFSNVTGGEGARLLVEADGAWTNGSSHPSRLVFSVTADGAASPTEALRISSNRAITVSDGGHIVLGTGTGTKIGTSTSQKIGFFDETPIVQPTTGIAEAAFVENSGGTAVNVDSTFGGYTIQQVVQALQNLGLLA